MPPQEKSDNEPELTPRLEAARDDAISLALQARAWSRQICAVVCCAGVGPSWCLPALAHAYMARSQGPICTAFKCHDLPRRSCLQAGAVQQECGLPITPDEFVASTLKFGLTEASFVADCLGAAGLQWDRVWSQALPTRIC